MGSGVGDGGVSVAVEVGANVGDEVGGMVAVRVAVAGGPVGLGGRGVAVSGSLVRVAGIAVWVGETGVAVRPGNEVAVAVWAEVSVGVAEIEIGP
jgi:hypothetical protein